MYTVMFNKLEFSIGCLRWRVVNRWWTYVLILPHMDMNDTWGLKMIKGRLQIKWQLHSGSTESHQSVSSLTTWNKSLSQVWIHCSLPGVSDGVLTLIEFTATCVDLTMNLWPPHIDTQHSKKKNHHIPWTDESVSQLLTPSLPRFSLPPSPFSLTFFKF